MMKPASLTGEKAEQADLNRLYVLLEDERERLNLTVSEAAAVADALKSTAVLSGLDYRRAICLAVEDACELEGLDEKWGIQVDTLLERLAHLSPGQAMALIDGVERFWGRMAEDGESDPESLLRTVGLL